MSFAKSHLFAAMTIVTVLGISGAGRASESYFYPDSMLRQCSENVKKYPALGQTYNNIVANAKVWMKYSDAQLWDWMFGATITRSWMVWSDGYCPKCKKDVPMYTWVMDPFGNPGMWKVKCPHCSQVFPTNDFEKFYKSGMDKYGVFDPELADRSLLFNAEHPDANDPLHKFGVDDGEGYVQDGHRWRFIGAYLIYGQWKRLVHGGIKSLASAYTVTRDPNYAHKAAVLLDRVADLYPTFDFMNQAFVYEKVKHNGYVSVWHDAAEETRELAIAYDQIKPAIDNDKALAAFLSGQAKKYNLINTKTTPELVHKNIQDGILNDAIKSNHKIWSNYPRRELALININCALGTQESINKAHSLIGEVITKATAIDGVTGEKGVTCYSAGTIHSLAVMLEQFSRRDANFLPALFKQYPQLKKTWRFHLDILCLDRYYPQVGDGGHYAYPQTGYIGLFPSIQAATDPSLFSFLWRLYEITGDKAYAQLIFKLNKNIRTGLPHDLFGMDTRDFENKVEQVINDVGTDIELESVNKEQWHIAVLRSGSGKKARAAWIVYDSGRQHGHRNGMHLGLFAHELDLGPDFGYAPVNYGGWYGRKTAWYVSSASHNTVVVDNKNHNEIDGKTTLYAPGGVFQAITVSGAGMIGGKQFERTIITSDISSSKFYVVDIFRVVGGKDHAKFFTSHFGTVSGMGLKLSPGEGYFDVNEMIDFETDKNPALPWAVEWKIEDRYGLTTGSGQKDIRLRYTDLTDGASASICKTWVQAGPSSVNAATYVPRVVVRRADEKGELASVFISVMEPYEGASAIKSIRRLDLSAENKPAGRSDVAIEIALVDGRKDVIIATDQENAESFGGAGATKAVRDGNYAFETDGMLACVRTDGGKVRSAMMAKGQKASFGGKAIKLENRGCWGETADKTGL